MTSKALLFNLWTLCAWSVYVVVYSSESLAGGKDLSRKLAHWYIYTPSSSENHHSCELDLKVLHLLNEQRQLNNSTVKRLLGGAREHGGDVSVLIKAKYGQSWTSLHTCFLLNQLLLTEALGGHHPHCNIHSQNRNLLYALLTKAGSMSPAKEAVRVFGKLIHHYNFERARHLSALQKDESVHDWATMKARLLENLQEAGLAEVKPVRTKWVNNVVAALENETFLLRTSTERKSVKGFSPEIAAAKGWYGSFWLKDLNAAIRIPSVQTLAYDPFLLDIIQDLLGAPPVIRAVDVSFNLAPSDGRSYNSSFENWHKDFNSVRSVKVFVYLSDALDDESGPHAYIPGTQNILGPMSNDSCFAGYPDSLSAQNIPEDYLLRNIFHQPVQRLKRPAGTVWIEDTHVFHKADVALKGWRGLLQIDYTASGFCTKDHSSLYQVLSSLPSSPLTKEMNQHFPRLFQRAKLGYYARPNVKKSKEFEQLALPLEAAFGQLQYDGFEQDASTHAEYIQAGFATGGAPTNSDRCEEQASTPCWEKACARCLQKHLGTCEICSEEHICTCSCPVYNTTALKASKGLEDLSARALTPLRPIDREKYTIRILSWKRPLFLETSVKHHSSCPGVAQIQVVWSDLQGQPPPASVRNNPKTIIEHRETNSLNNRFDVREDPPTLGIMSLDDELLFPCEALDAEFFLWTNAPERIVTLAHRTHSVQQDGSWRYKTGDRQRYSIGLMGRAFLHKGYLDMYTNYLPRAMYEHIEDIFNCEDIAMSMFVSSLTDGKPPLLADSWAAESAVFMKELIGNRDGLSNRKSHYVDRSNCLDSFADQLSMKWKLQTWPVKRAQVPYFSENPVSEGLVIQRQRALEEALRSAFISKPRRRLPLFVAEKKRSLENHVRQTFTKEK